MDIRHLYIVVGFIGLPKRYKGTSTGLICVREGYGCLYYALLWVMGVYGYVYI